MRLMISAGGSQFGSPRSAIAISRDTRQLNAATSSPMRKAETVQSKESGISNPLHGFKNWTVTDLYLNMMPKRVLCRCHYNGSIYNARTIRGTHETVPFCRSSCWYYNGYIILSGWTISCGRTSNEMSPENETHARQNPCCAGEPT
jgi:hypothetical protein